MKQQLTFYCRSSQFTFKMNLSVKLFGSLKHKPTTKKKEKKRNNIVVVSTTEIQLKFNARKKM